MSIRRHLVETGMKLWNRQLSKDRWPGRPKYSWFEVEIVSAEDTGCMVRWNNNRPAFWNWRSVEKLYRNRKP